MGGRAVAPEVVLGHVHPLQYLLEKVITRSEETENMVHEMKEDFDDYKLETVEQILSSNLYMYNVAGDVSSEDMQVVSNGIKLVRKRIEERQQKKQQQSEQQPPPPSPAAISLLAVGALVDESFQLGPGGQSNASVCSPASPGLWFRSCPSAWSKRCAVATPCRAIDAAVPAARAAALAAAIPAAPGPRGFTRCHARGPRLEDGRDAGLCSQAQ